VRPTAWGGRRRARLPDVDHLGVVLDGLRGDVVVQPVAQHGAARLAAELLAARQLRALLARVDVRRVEPRVLEEAAERALERVAPDLVTMFTSPPWKLPYSAPAPSPFTSTLSIQSTFGWRNAPPRPGWFAWTPSSWYRFACSVEPPNTWFGRAPGVNWMSALASRGVGSSSRSRSARTLRATSTVARLIALGAAVTCTAESSVALRTSATSTGVAAEARTRTPATSTGRWPRSRTRTV
jgi:hypothetical protein